MFMQPVPCLICSLAVSNALRHSDSLFSLHRKFAGRDTVRLADCCLTVVPSCDFARKPLEDERLVSHCLGCFPAIHHDSSTEFTSNHLVDTL